MVDLKRRQALGLIASTATLLPAQAVIAGSAKNKPQVAATLKDPDLINPTYPWARVLTDEELVTLAALCDMIIPADGESPAASAAGVQHYINEHVSAPYDQHRADLVEVRGGIIWLNCEAGARFCKPFAALSVNQKSAICDDICRLDPARPQFHHGAHFFNKIRNMTAAGYFTTAKGMAYVGYVGNKPMLEFPPPPGAVLNKLGLEKINEAFSRKS